MIADYKQNQIKFVNEIVLFAVDRFYQEMGIDLEVFKLASSIFEKSG